MPFEDTGLKESQKPEALATDRFCVIRGEAAQDAVFVAELVSTCTFAVCTNADTGDKVALHVSTLEISMKSDEIAAGVKALLGENVYVDFMGACSPEINSYSEIARDQLVASFANCGMGIRYVQPVEDCWRNIRHTEEEVSVLRFAVCELDEPKDEETRRYGALRYADGFEDGMFQAVANPQDAHISSGSFQGKVSGEDSQEKKR